MPHSATFVFEYKSADEARRIFQSIEPEVDDIEDDRSGVSVECSGISLEVTVESADLVALRAATNTWLSLVTVAEKTGGIERQAGHAR